METNSTQPKWETSETYIGMVEEKTKTVFYFKYNGNPEDIEEIKPACKSCTEIKGFNGKLLIASFAAGTFPKQLKELKELDFTRRIDVVYKNGHIDNLYFSGTIFRD